MRQQEKTPGGKGCRVYHDLTKRRLALLNSARKECEAIPGWYAYADINSGLKLRCEKKFHSFNTRDELDAAIAMIKQQ